MSNQLVQQLSERHVPNTPRTHDPSGRVLVEPTQCRACLQRWPCETRQLLDLLDNALDLLDAVPV